MTYNEPIIDLCSPDQSLHEFLIKLTGNKSELFHLKNLENAISVSSIISFTTKRGVIIYINKNFERISGYTQQELIGSDHRLINSGLHNREFWLIMWQTIASGDFWRGEVRNKRKDGSFYWVDTFIYPFRNQSEEVIGYLSIRNDISIRKEQKLELEKRNKSLEEIAFMQSHGFRAPVATILGLVQIFDYENTDVNYNRTILAKIKKVAQELDFQSKQIVRISEHHS